MSEIATRADLEALEVRLIAALKEALSDAVVISDRALRARVAKLEDRVSSFPKAATHG